MSLLEKLRQDVEGLKLLNDWLGEGGNPVPSLQVESRAEACVRGNAGQPCPMNKAANWWNLHENAKNAIAQTIRAELELKYHLDLHAPNEEALHLCAVCGCCTALKVHTPIKHIKAHTTPEQLAKYPRHCWIKKEIEHE